MAARRRRFVDSTRVYTEEDLEKGTADLTAVVRAVQAGVRYGPPPAPTRREREIVNCFAEDCTVEEIAEQLTISVYTVRSHVENMRVKYQKRSIAGIVALALRQGWIG